ncbi:hypothetical protein K402DRAFT_91087 [Aulographum hederae CBS 113979]|uniref:Uncharacterized protein n=1 Tax=Aulographum hederae CBS 113979 TaxID=1176131 RepID=A0A6G1GZL4_9PEZI|nr:hypothetical protein K402DRAFT_91087 [Aulographum hederae CBS 113979]
MASLRPSTRASRPAMAAISKSRAIQSRSITQQLAVPAADDVPVFIPSTAALQSSGEPS